MTSDISVFILYCLSVGFAWSGGVLCNIGVHDMDILTGLMGVALLFLGVALFLLAVIVGGVHHD